MHDSISCRSFFYNFIFSIYFAEDEFIAVQEKEEKKDPSFFPRRSDRLGENPESSEQWHTVARARTNVPSILKVTKESHISFKHIIHVHFLDLNEVFSDFFSHCDICFCCTVVNVFFFLFFFFNDSLSVCLWACKMCRGGLRMCLCIAAYSTLV